MYSLVQRCGFQLIIRVEIEGTECCSIENEASLRSFAFVGCAPAVLETPLLNQYLHVRRCS